MPQANNHYKDTSKTHWSKLPEKGNLLALKIMLAAVKLIGRRITYCLAYPVMVYFYCFNKTARLASQQYFLNLATYARHQNIHIKAMAFQQFVAFGHNLVDKVAVWNHQITREHLNFPNRHELLHLINSKQGFVIFSAHLGNIEIMRAIASSSQTCKINALIFNQHAQKFNELLTTLNPDSQLNLIPVVNFDLSIAMQLQHKIDQGEIVIIACDRTPTSRKQHLVSASFLGKKAQFPQGGFLLAYLLRAPVYTMLCLKNKQKYDVIFRLFATQLHLSRQQREQELTQYAQQYSDFLAEYCLQYPTQWFNFFDFWRKSDE